MLYLWPYLIFFSVPVVVPQLVTSAIKIFTHRPDAFNIFRQILTFTIATVIAAGVIHYNTIVHPFTLADNRHYVFYVFRVLLRHPAIRYLAAPAYILCANLAIQALGGRKSAKKSAQKSEKETSAVISSSGCTASLVIIWLATTTLSLVTAPLVEPRYCIIPWIMWRLHVPRSAIATEEKKEVKESWSLKASRDDQIRLLLETAWFCCINAVTGYIFLYWGFEWPQEEGKVQRFMW
jgi:alpha-1,2-glucosyltransferase